MKMRYCTDVQIEPVDTGFIIKKSSSDDLVCLSSHEGTVLKMLFEKGLEDTIEHCQSSYAGAEIKENIEEFTSGLLNLGYIEEYEE